MEAPSGYHGVLTMPTIDYTTEPLPIGARYVYKAFGLTLEQGLTTFPPELFEDELQAAEILLRNDYPCIVTDGALNLSGGDLLLYSMAVGYKAAGFIQGGDASAPGVGGPTMVKRKMLDTEYTFKVTTPEERGATWEDLVDTYMGGIQCIGGPGVLKGPRAGLLQIATQQVDYLGRMVDAFGRVY